MITQAQYSDALFRASLVNMTLVSSLVDFEAGGAETDWSNAFCNQRIIASGMFCFLSQDYNSAKSLLVYESLLLIAGQQFSSSPMTDPNAQGLPIIIVQNGAYTPPNNVNIAIPIGSANPFIYNYTGSNIIKGYRVELNAGGGNYYFAPNIQVEVNGNSFTITGDFSLDNYRLVIVTA